MSGQAMYGVMRPVKGGMMRQVMGSGTGQAMYGVRMSQAMEGVMGSTKGGMMRQVMGSGTGPVRGGMTGQAMYSVKMSQMMDRETTRRAMDDAMKGQSMHVAPARRVQAKGRREKAGVAAGSCRKPGGTGAIASFFRNYDAVG